MDTSDVARAKDFLVDRIVDQARRENVSLTGIEIKMLIFAEASASAEEMNIAEAFDREYDDNAYEAKIAALLKNAYDRDMQAGKKAEWDGHLDELANEDMYILVMLEQAGIMKSSTFLSLPDWRMFAGLVPALVFLVAGIVAAFTPFGTRLFPNVFVRLCILVVLWSAPFLIGQLRRD